MPGLVKNPQTPYHTGVPDFQNALGPDRRRKQLLLDIGRAGVHALFPNDFEYYLITLELVNSKDETVDYLAFPVNPDSMTYTNPQLTNVKKTLGGIVELDTSSFVPKRINFNGTFGRKFKVLLQPLTLDVTRGPGKRKHVPSFDSGYGYYGPGGGGQIPGTGKIQIQTNFFNPKIKTGYGTTKLLEALLEKSKGLDEEGKPFRLYLYNPALGHNWMVTVKNFVFSQDYSTSNMLWRYNVDLEIIAPLAAIKPDLKTSLLEALGVNILQRGATRLLNDIKRSL